MGGNVRVQDFRMSSRRFHSLECGNLLGTWSIGTAQRPNMMTKPLSLSDSCSTLPFFLRRHIGIVEAHIEQAANLLASQARSLDSHHRKRWRAKTKILPNTLFILFFLELAGTIREEEI